MKLSYNNRPLVAAATNTRDQIFSKVAFQTAQASSFAAKILHCTVYVVKYYFMHEHHICAYKWFSAFPSPWV